MVRLISFLVIGILCWLGISVLGAICDEPKLGFIFGFFFFLIIDAYSISSTIALSNFEKRDNKIKSSLNENYPGYTNFNCDRFDKSFVYDGKKYTFVYDDDMSTLTVFEDNDLKVDGAYKLIQGQDKDPNTNGKEVSSETTSESAATDTSKEFMNLDSTAVSENQEGLAKRIQDKIQEKYANAVITSFDTTNLTGTFESDTGDYGFSWSDNMLEIFNLENKNQNVYYKVSVFYEVD